MATITEQNDVVTLINVFKVDHARQQTLVDLLVDATDQTMRHQQGFVSANIHRGLDGTHVANYAQWRSRADFERMLEDPEAQQHMRRAYEMSTVEPVLYEVSSVHQ